MGLKPVTFKDWIAPQKGGGHFLAERTSLIGAKQQDVIATPPGARDPLTELAGILRHAR